MKIQSALVPELAEATIDRFDLDRDERIVATVDDPPRQRWFRREHEGWREIQPNDDTQLPFARELERLAHEGPLDVLSWKPGRRMTLEGPYGRGRAIYKARRKSAHADALSAHVGAELLLHDSGFVCPPLYAHAREHSVLVFERLEARPLSIRRTDVERFHAIGRGLRRVQERQPSVYLGLHGPRDEERVLHRMRERTLAIRGDEPQGAAALLVRASKLFGELRPATPMVAHRDLHDGQFLVRGDELVLLDFDLLCLADAALDAANLAAHLELRALQGLAGADHESARACGEALFDGLGRQRERGFERRVHFYRGATFLRLAWVYHARPRYAALGPRLLDLSRAAFDAFQADV